jgi:hypothetical protein
MDQLPQMPGLRLLKRAPSSAPAQPRSCSFLVYRLHATGMISSDEAADLLMMEGDLARLRRTAVTWELVAVAILISTFILALAVLSWT